MDLVHCKNVLYEIFYFMFSILACDVFFVFFLNLIVTKMLACFSYIRVRSFLPDMRRWFCSPSLLVSPSLVSPLPEPSAYFPASVKIFCLFIISVNLGRSLPLRASLFVQLVPF